MRLLYKTCEKVVTEENQIFTLQLFLLGKMAHCMSSALYAAGPGSNPGESNFFDSHLIFEFNGCVGCETIKKE